MASVSPARISLAGFTRFVGCTLPLSTAALASERVLKKRAAHSHLSIRVRSGWSEVIGRLTKYPG
ncbi:MAG: hypothetical protein IPH26_05825 [Sterolibacteriaceae bacterium]|uniref:Uncharacterized protein n=1 Tax=Candidatus Methylophosphatis roskildensis TaxID=2899263 RepID=A0A9D7HT97_9PROT|nr:hypothetical protein [Candidatus Methylophosphatis roskildensis]